MFIANYTIVNWGPHSMWLLNCSDDINNTMYDYITQVTWKVTNTTWNVTMTEDFLASLMMEWPPHHPRIILDKQIGPKQ